MFKSKQRRTVIAKGLKIVGSVTAEGLVEVNGQIEGELHCTSLVIARGAHVNGIVVAELRGGGRKCRRSNSGRTGLSEIASTCSGRYSPPISSH